MTDGVDGRRTVVVFGDSLSYYGPKGGLPSGDRQIWPNVMAAELDVDVELFAQVGWTSRDMWWAVTRDPRIWQALPTADVVVFAIGGMDSLPSPLPTALRESIRYLRPDALRARVRDAYQWLQPRLSPLGWPMAVPPSLTVAYLERTRAAIAALRPDMRFVVQLPPTHASPYYGHAHPGRERTTAAMAEWAASRGVGTVELYDITRRHHAGDEESNPDGIHWGFACHRRVAVATADAIR